MRRPPPLLQDCRIAGLGGNLQTCNPALWRMGRPFLLEESPGAPGPEDTSGRSIFREDRQDCSIAGLPGPASVQSCNPALQRRGFAVLRRRVPGLLAMRRVWPMLQQDCRIARLRGPAQRAIPQSCNPALQGWAVLSSRRRTLRRPISREDRRIPPVLQDAGLQDCLGQPHVQSCKPGCRGGAILCFRRRTAGLLA